MSLHNRLLRQVKKHKSMSVLFRGWEPYSRKPTVAPEASNMVQARLAEDAQSSEEMDEAVPALPVIKPMPVAQARQIAPPQVQVAKDPQIDSDVSSLEPGSRVHEANQPLQMVFRKHQTSSEPTSIKVAAMVPPDAMKRNTLPDRKQSFWQRVERIFRKHHEPAEAKSAEVTSEGSDPIEPAESIVPRPGRAKEEPSLQQRARRDVARIFRNRQEPIETVSRTESASPAPQVESARELSHKPPDPEWQRLQAIFRKHQEKQEDEEASPAKLPGLESPRTKPMGPIQHSVENVKSRPQPVGVQRSVKDPGLPSPSNQREPVAKAQVAGHQTQTKAAKDLPETPERAPDASHPPQEALPLQSVWNVQRVDVPESQALEPNTPFDVHQGSSISYEPDVDDEAGTETARAISGKAEELLTEMDTLPPTGSSISSKGPVEILPPSRPRPLGASVTAPQEVIQRQPENRESPLVDTAIGPLPSDLWSLLGQKPPVHSNQPQIQVATPAGSNGQRIFSDSYTSTAQERSIPGTSSPAIIQRQTPPDGTSMPANSVQDQTAQSEKASQTEPNLDDLAQRVYSEIRHRLTLEWERMRRK
jgi:hypothetical protein